MKIHNKKHTMQLGIFFSLGFFFFFSQNVFFSIYLGAYIWRNEEKLFN